MSAREVLDQYLLGSQLTNRLTLEEFRDIVVKRVGNESRTVVSSEKVKEWYEAYQQRDQVEAESIKFRVDQFLSKIERDEMLNLEKAQLQEAFTLEELVDSLYTVDQVLNSKLGLLNRSFESNVDVFNKLNDVLAKANETKSHGNMEEIASELAEYRRILQTSKKC